MILTQKRRYCKKNCNCENCYKKIQNYDVTADVNAPLSLEEHFENFTDSVAEVAENFLRGKKGRARNEKRIERKEARKEARQEKRVSRIKGRQDIRESRAEALRSASEEAIKQGQEKTENIKLKNLQAQQQADQVNQLQKMVQPEAPPVSASQTPTGASGGSNEPLFKTLPDSEAPAQAPTPEEQEATETAKGTEAPTTTTEAPKKSNTMVYIIIAVAIFGAYYLMKKK